MTIEEIVKTFYDFGEEKELSSNLEWFKNHYGIELGEAVSEENLKYVEEHFGKIPNVLKNLYSICNNNINLMTCQDEWILPGFYKRWDWLKNSKDFVIANENQGVCQAVIKKCDLEKETPPVYVTAEFDEKKYYNLCTNLLEEFIKAFLVYQSSLCMPYFSENFYYISEEEFEFIKDNFKEYDFYLENWIVDGKFRLFYDTPGSVVCVFADDLQMHYGANTKEDFNRIKEMIGDFGEPIYQYNDLGNVGK